MKEDNSSLNNDAIYYLNHLPRVSLKYETLERVLDVVKQ